MKPEPPSSTKNSPPVQVSSGAAASAAVLTRCLVVAEDACPTGNVQHYLRERCDQVAHSFHVVVPHRRRTVLVSDPALCSVSDRHEITVSGREHSVDVAEAQLDGFLRLLTELGQPFTGEVASGDLMKKVQHLANLGGFDEILVLTTNQRRRIFGRRRDLVAALRRACEIPVTAVAVIESEA